MILESPAENHGRSLFLHEISERIRIEIGLFNVLKITVG